MKRLGSQKFSEIILLGPWYQYQMSQQSDSSSQYFFLWIKRCMKCWSVHLLHALFKAFWWNRDWSWSGRRWGADYIVMQPAAWRMSWQGECVLALSWLAHNRPGEDVKWNLSKARVMEEKTAHVFIWEERKGQEHFVSRKLTLQNVSFIDFACLLFSSTFSHLASIQMYNFVTTVHCPHVHWPWQWNHDTQREFKLQGARYLLTEKNRNKREGARERFGKGGDSGDGLGQPEVMA